MEQRLQGARMDEPKLPKICFEYTSPYSPDYNLAEYAIRITRQKYLHHLPSKDSLEEIAVRLEYIISTQGLMSKVRWLILLSIYWSYEWEGGNNPAKSPRDSNIFNQKRTNRRFRIKFKQAKQQTKTARF